MEHRLLSERSQIYHSADPFAVSEYVNQHVGPHCIRLPTHGHPLGSINHRRFANLDLCRLSYGGAVRVMSPALESIYHLQVLLEGHCRSRGQGGERDYLPGQMLLINPDDPVDLTYSADCEKFIVKLPVSLFDQACRDHQWEVPRNGVRFAAMPQQDMRTLDGFYSLLALMCEEAESAACMPQIQAHYARIVASKLLTLLRTNVIRAEPVSTSRGFDSLHQWIEAHLTDDVGIAQMMAVAHVSERSLYALFERNANTSPMEYVRQRKLDRIHELLACPNASVPSVTALALDYGFLHLGRFSQSYKARFGELPSQTLKNRH